MFDTATVVDEFGSPGPYCRGETKFGYTTSVTEYLDTFGEMTNTGGSSN